jgi:hypothetical protein
MITGLVLIAIGAFLLGMVTAIVFERRTGRIFHSGPVIAYRARRMARREPGMSDPPGRMRP